MSSFILYLAVSLFAFTQFRIASFKITEMLMFLSIATMLSFRVSRRILDSVTKAYALFLIFSIYALLISFINISDVPLALETSIEIDQKGFFYSYFSIPFITVFRHFATFFFTIFVANMMFNMERERLKKLISVAYIITVSFGVYQIIKLVLFSYVGFQLPNIPLVERCYEDWPLCGIFNGGPYSKRILGPAYEPLDYGCSVMVISFIYWYLRKKIPVIGFILIILSISKGTIIGILLGLLAVLIFKNRYKYIYAALFGAFASFYTFLYLMRDKFMEYFYLLNLPGAHTGGVRERVCIQFATIDMFVDNLKGVGLKLWFFFYGFYDICHHLPPPNACNDALQFLAEGGVFLFIGYLVLIYYFFKYSAFDKKLLLATTALVIQSFTVSLYLMPVFWIMFAFIASENLKRSETSKEISDITTDKTLKTSGKE